MHKVHAALGVTGAALALGLGLATLPHPVGPNAHVVSASAPAPVATRTKPAPVTTTTSTTTAPVRPVAASKPKPAPHAAAPAHLALTVPTAHRQAPVAPVVPLNPVVYVFDPIRGDCFATGQAEATADHFQTIPAADCVNGWPVGPQYVVHSTPPTTTAGPDFCQVHPTDTACWAGNGPGRQTPPTTEAPGA